MCGCKKNVKKEVLNSKNSESSNQEKKTLLSTIQNIWSDTDKVNSVKETN